jgi:hypothetical protein
MMVLCIKVKFSVYQNNTKIPQRELLLVGKYFSLFTIFFMCVCVCLISLFFLSLTESFDDERRT